MGDWTTKADAEDILERLGDLNPEAIVWPDLNDALLGVGQQFNTYVAVYSFEGMVECLVARDGITRDEAEEYLYFNTLGAYTGPYTPVVLFTE